MEIWLTDLFGVLFFIGIFALVAKGLHLVISNDQCGRACRKSRVTGRE